MKMFATKLFATNRGDGRRNLRVLTAMVCVLLILFVGAAQILHMHSPDETANASCSLCAVAHATALPAPVLGTLVVAEAVAPVAPPAAVSAPKRFFSFSLYVRPPPVATSTLS
jgi:hypothetical protein